MVFDNITLSQIPNAIHFDAQQLQDHLAEVIELKRTSPVTISSIIDAAGYTVGKQICASIWQIASVDSIVHAAYYAMTTVGIDLSRPDRQAMIDAIAAEANWPVEWSELVKSLGVYKQPRYSFFGFQELPSIEECQEWLAQKQFDYKKSRAIEMWISSIQLGDDPAEVMQLCWDNA